MKETTITQIPGFSADTTPDDKPMLGVFGPENTGKTRLGCTAPCSDGLLAFLALDKNSKRGIECYKQEYPDSSSRIIVNSEPLASPTEWVKVALMDSAVKEDLAKIQGVYTEMVKKVFDRTMTLVKNPNVESIVIDDCSQLFDWIMFSHFGRRNQIESYQRGAPNQDMIDFITALGSKNTVLIHRGADVWADTGETDKQGRKKQAPTGRLKPEGFGKLGKFMTAVVELSVARGKIVTHGKTEDQIYAEKYRCRVQSCKGNTLVEGCDLGDEEYGGVKGREITWDGIMQAIGVWQ
jgi:hypothetical protein